MKKQKLVGIVLEQWTTTIDEPSGWPHRLRFNGRVLRAESKHPSENSWEECCNECHFADFNANARQAR